MNLAGSLGHHARLYCIAVDCAQYVVCPHCRRCAEHCPWSPGKPWPSEQPDVAEQPTGPDNP